MTDYKCRWKDCGRSASDEPMSVFCPKHIKVMRPYDDTEQ